MKKYVLEINKLASRKNVRKIAVENFLMPLGNSPMIARYNLQCDARSYKWNSPTVQAINACIECCDYPDYHIDYKIQE